MSQRNTSSTTTTPSTQRGKKRNTREEPDEPVSELDIEIVKEILKEVRANSAVWSQVREDLATSRRLIANIDNKAINLATKVAEIAEATVAEREEMELNSLSKEERKKLKKICEELWWVQKEDVKASLGLALENTHSFQNRVKFRAAVRKGLQWFCNKRSNFRASCEMKAPAFFLNGTPTFSAEEMEEFTKHMLGNKRRHTDSDVAFVTKVLNNYYVPQNQ